MLKALCALALLILITGCGGGSSSRGGTPTPTPTPSSGVLTVCEVDPNNPNNCFNPAVIGFGVQAQFRATLTAGGTTPTLNWFVNGVQGGASATGTISSSGMYTAPAQFDSGVSVTITATAPSNSSDTGNATAVIVNNNIKETAPVMMGTTGGNSNDSVTSGGTITCCSGTLGSLINKGGNLFILSNNHVLDKSSFGATGDPIGQPGLIDNACNPGATVATLSQAAALKPASGTTGPSPSNVDAAIAQIVVGQVDPGGNILDLGAPNGAGINPAPPSSTLAVPSTVLSTNEKVAKVGRSSGLTCSTVSSVSTSVQVDYDSSCGGSKAFTSSFTNQVIVSGGNFSSAGDSGSLIVTADTARPVALLFAGNNSSTTGNPVQDVIAALGPFTFVGGADHAVSCSAVGQSGIATATATSASLGAQERARVGAVLQRRGAMLRQDPAVTSVEIGVSQDRPGEGALLIRVSGPTSTPIPATIDGVRTAVVASAESAAQMPVLSGQDITDTAAIKDAHAKEFMSEPGIQGVGVGRSSDNPSQTAIVIYVITGVAHPAIPQTIDGVRTKVIEGDRFRAFGWGKETAPASKCVKKK